MPTLKPISEAAFQRQVLDLAKLTGWRAAHFRAVRVQRKNGSVYHETPAAADGAGWPDLVLTRRSRCLFRELKTDDGRLSPEQSAWLLALHEAGLDVDVWRPRMWGEIERILKGGRP